MPDDTTRQAENLKAQAERRLELNPRQLYHFEILAETGSATNACRFLGIGPSALTQSISRLEAELDAELFDRSTRPARLTAAGAHLLDFVRRQSAEIEALRERFAMEQGRHSGIMRIGCGARWMVDIVPRALAGFRAAFPDMRVRITVDQMPQLFDKLDKREVGLVLGTIDNVRLFSHHRVQEMGLDRFTVVARRGHPLHGRERIPLADLLHQPWIMSDAAASSTVVLRQLLREAGFAPITPVVELTDTLAVASTMRQTDCIGILSSSTAGNFAEIESLSVDFKLPVSRSAAISLDSRDLSPAESAFVDLVRKGFKSAADGQICGG
ncbi:LysR family transcriptional regulator [Cereibacter changlensis]|uniref:LysR family transcriptional regulator n=1 Tax=Cereibacter changlensis TaxID=402884 RepID=UPI00200A7189|nr:LysR family transcriptional regulator [Cereibacter changlensis]